MNLFVKLMIFGGSILFILDLIVYFKYRINIHINKYVNLIICTMILAFCIVIFDKLGIGMGMGIGMNMSNGFNQGAKYSSSLILFMLFALSIVTFIPGVIKLNKNNDYKEIRSTAILLGIFAIVFISFKFIGIA